MDTLDLHELWFRVGIDLPGAIAVVVSTIAIYSFFVLLVRLLGQRTLARMSGFDVAAVIALGAITGRVTLGHTPTLAAGAIALLTLFSAEAIVGEVRRMRFGARLFDNSAIALVIDGVVQRDLMRRAHILDDELRSAMRRAGVRRIEDVAIVVLERTGELSVLTNGTTIDPYMVNGVRGSERIPGHLLRY